MPKGVYKRAKYKGKQHPRLTTAMRVFKDKYDDGNMTFDQFLQLSQLPCHYCGKHPSNSVNPYLTKSYPDCSDYAKQNGEFVYSGLDRIDNNRPHDCDNLIPCCAEHNRMRRQYTYEFFLDSIIKIYNRLNLGRFADGYFI